MRARSREAGDKEDSQRRSACEHPKTLLGTRFSAFRAHVCRTPRASIRDRNLARSEGAMSLRTPTRLTDMATNLFTSVRSVAVPVSDQDRSRSLLEQLGFTVSMDTELRPGFRWIEMNLAGGGASIALVRTGPELPTRSTPVSAWRPTTPRRARRGGSGRPRRRRVARLARRTVDVLVRRLRRKPLLRQRDIRPSLTCQNRAVGLVRWLRNKMEADDGYEPDPDEIVTVAHVSLILSNMVVAELERRGDSSGRRRTTRRIPRPRPSTHHVLCEGS